MNENEVQRLTAQSPDRRTASWSTPIALGIITAALSVLNPTLLVFVPLAFMLVALAPRKPFLMLMAVALLIAAFTGKPDGVLWYYARGWSLILSAWFVFAIVLMPQGTTIARSLAAITGSVASVALLFGINHAGWYSLDYAIAHQLRSAAGDIAGLWNAKLAGKPWADEMQSAIFSFTNFQAMTYPAMLAVASLSGLALAYWVWRRVSVRDPQPLGRLREFKFNDELVWVVVLGAALLALPLHHAADRAGANLLTFMAALYALRGLAVIIALFGAPTLFGAFFGALVTVMLYPLVMATTLMVGLTDTWLDLRARRSRNNEKH